MVIHHMPDMVAAIKMFKSMLKPNGLLFIYEFEATDNAKAGALKDKKKSHGVFHAGLTPSTFMELMQAAGLKTLHSKVFSNGLDETLAFAFLPTNNNVTDMKILGN
mmetsp:Transcript_38640/g.62801  ORF Transcript_38640/g.62801 Transcript_38640/m.62801 type:complete len:106 (-) Transcript_38640:486-803(-)